MNDRYASVHIDVDPLGSKTAATELPEEPFTIILAGDFSVGSSRNPARSDRSLRVIPVDRDDFDAVLEQLSPRVRLALEPGVPPIEIEFRELDDFHPDALHDRTPLFAHLREMRRRALDPQQLPALATELGRGAVEQASPSGSVPAPAPPADGSVLDLILEQAQPPGADPSAEAILAGGGLSDIVRQLVAPHLVPRPDPRQAEVLSAIDAAAAEGMRRLLHHPSFQEIESLWRGLFLLVRSIETDRMLRLGILDTTVEELTRNSAKAEATLTAEGQAPAPALLVVLHSFTDSEADLAMLRQIGELAARLRAPCLAGAAPELVGIDRAATLTDPAQWKAPSPAWSELRREAAARYLGLAIPRFLLRTPYGEDGEEIDRFAFEELEGETGDQSYLWGNPALACAILLARSFRSDGWRMRPNASRELEGLPLVLVRGADDVSTRPSAEAMLPDTAVEALLDRGVMPILPLRDRGAVRIARFQSIAEPLAPLAGRWAST